MIRQNQQIRDELRRQTAYLQGPEPGKAYDAHEKVNGRIAVVALAFTATLFGFGFHIIWYIELVVLAIVVPAYLVDWRRKLKLRRR